MSTSKELGETPRDHARSTLGNTRYEKTQARLAYGAFALFGSMIVFGALTTLIGDSGAFERIKAIFQITFGSVVSLVAAAFAYYFRRRT